MTDVVAGLQVIRLLNIFLCGANLLLRYTHVFVGNVSCLSVCFELIGTFYGHGYGLCLSVRFVVVHTFVGAVRVLHYFSCLSIYYLFEEMRQRNHLFIYCSL